MLDTDAEVGQHDPQSQPSLWSMTMPTKAKQNTAASKEPAAKKAGAAKATPAKKASPSAAKSAPTKTASVEK